jgi:hypothetical protein
MGLSTVSFPPGSIWDTEVQQAMASWNAVERSDFLFYYWRDTYGTFGFDDTNGENEVVFYTLDGPGNTLAVTHLWYRGCDDSEDDRIVETDVIFDSDESWYTGTFSYTSSNIHFRLVAVHEFGHALGLSPRQDLHENRFLERMNSFYPNGGPDARSRNVGPLADSRLGVRFLYPGAGTAKPNLVGSNYKRTGNGSSALVSGPSSAARGSSVTVEFTFMNLGSTNSGSFNIGFYLSTDDNITTSDRLLGTSSNAWANAGGVGTFSRTLTIPSNVAPGTYYLGILLDKNGTVSELNENDNGLAQPRTVRIY